MISEPTEWAQNKKYWGKLMNELSEILTERALMEYLDLSKRQMEDMRVSGLPCLKISRRVRLYRESSVAAWLAQHEEKHERVKRSEG